MTVEPLEVLLREHPFFRGLAEPDITFIAGCGRNVVFETGEYLFREGGEANQLFILRRGRVALETLAPGRGAVVIDTSEAGDVIGYSWLFAPYRWHFDGRALEPVRAVALDGVCLRGKCEADPRLGYELMKRVASILIRRLQSARLRLIDMYRP
jgi:CRP/FNR family transcriptional regulator, cyclic AMP receptor protein